MWPGNWSRLSDILTPGCFLCPCSHGGAELVPKEHLFSCFLPSLNSHCREAAIWSEGGQEQEINGSREQRERKLEQIGKQKLEN